MRVLFIVVTSACMWAHCVAAQQQSSKGAVPSDQGAINSEVVPEDLLQRSYAMARYFPPEEKCFHLFRLAEASSQLRSPRARALTRTWSNELFRNALGLPQGWNRAAFQKNSLELLARVDPLRAFRLLPKVEPPDSSDPQKAPEDLRAFAARKIFARVWDVKGRAALVQLRSEADEIGNTGEYPYAAMSEISNRLAQQKNTGARQQIFREALEFYRQGPKVRSANSEFIGYLESDWESLPTPVRLDALRTIVEHLTRGAKPDSSVSEVTRIVTEKGAISLKNENVALLYRILPRIRQLDPDWADRMEDDYPELKQAAAAGTPQYSSGVRVLNPDGGSPEQVAAAANRGLEAGLLTELRKQVTTDPEHATRLLSSLTDADVQVEGLATLAIGFKDRDPHRAAGFLASAQSAANKLPGNSDKLRAIVAVAEAAASLREDAKIDDSMGEAFGLGEELLSDDLDLHPGQTVYMTETLEELSRITRLGGQTAFEVTMNRLQHLKNETLQAYLLIAAAEGLEKWLSSAPSPQH